METTIVELSEADQGCPVKHVPLRPRVNIDWFPELLDLSVLHRPSHFRTRWVPISTMLTSSTTSTSRR